MVDQIKWFEAYFYGLKETRIALTTTLMMNLVVASFNICLTKVPVEPLKCTILLYS